MPPDIDTPQGQPVALRTHMPKILFNATTLNKGGALQNVVNFLDHVLSRSTGFQWSLCLSQAVADQLDASGIVLPPGSEVFKVSPARDAQARRRLKSIEARIAPDAVFTFNGPAYVDFAAPHLLGCTEPWVTHAGLCAYRSLGFPHEWLLFWLITQYKAHWFRLADRWVMQTENSRQGLHQRLGIPLDRIDVVSNSCGAGYFQRSGSVRPPPEPGRRLRLFCFSASYKHKNLRVLPAVAAELARLEPALDFEFVTTLPPCADLTVINERARRLGVAERFVNVGPVPIAKGPATYETCDVLFLPTVLETFSATYPEAMAMGLPIVTSDLDFARDTCGEAAVYFDPRDPRAGAEAILRLVRNPTLWSMLIARGKQELTRFPSPAQKSEAYLRLLRDMLAAR